MKLEAVAKGTQGKLNSANNLSPMNRYQRANLMFRDKSKYGHAKNVLAKGN